MKRSIFDVLPEFDGRKEFIDSVMDANGEDINKAKADVDSLKATIEEREKTIAELNEQIKSVESDADIVKSLQEKVAKYEADEKERNEEKQKALFEENMKNRFDVLIKDVEFVNDFTKQGAYNKFKELVADKSNEGKGDSQIYAELIKDNDSWFKSKQSFVNMQGLNHIDTSLIDAEAFKKMTLIQQMSFATNHPNEYAELSKFI